MLIDKDFKETFIPSKLETPAQATERYLRTIEDLGFIPERNKIKYDRIPLVNNLDDIKDAKERIEYQKDILSKWKHGDGNIVGAMWAYFNLYKIHNRSRGGMIKPNFQNYDRHEFDLWQSAVNGKGNIYNKYQGKDVLTLGARGKGKSSKIGVFAQTQAMFNPMSNQFLFSKDADSLDGFFYEKMVLSYSSLPQYITKTSRYLKSHKTFSLGKTYNNTSFIIGKVPVAEKAEGGGAFIVYYDEAPKTKDLEQIKSMTDGCLLAEDGFSKLGVNILTGVAGDFGKFGNDYIRFWDKYDSSYDFVRWFIPGWANMNLDEYGNEDIEKSVHQIMLARYKIARGGDEQAMINEMQKTPLSPEEALQTPTTSFINKHKVMLQYRSLSDGDSGFVRKGTFEWDADKKNPYFKDEYQDTILIQNGKGNKDSRWHILELPPRKLMKEPIKTDYVMFVDCYDIKEDVNSGSSGAAYVFKMPTNISPQRFEELNVAYEHAITIQEKINALLGMGGILVAEYIDMPDIEIFCDNVAKAFVAYNCFALVEKKPSLIFNTLVRDYSNYLQYKPRKPEDEDKIIKFKDLKEKGITIDDFWKNERNRVLKWYVDHHCHKIFFERLLNDLLSYDPEIQRKKHDSVDAFGGCIIHSQQEKLLAKLEKNEEVTSDIFFGMTWQNGKLHRI